MRTYELTTELLVIGGGPAGLTAAIAAAGRCSWWKRTAISAATRPSDCRS